MKKLILALLLITVASSAGAYGEFIGMSFDDQFSVCYGDAIGTPVVHFYAYLGADIGEITAAEFRVENFPEGIGAVAIPTWNTGLVIGSIDWGLALAFSPPLPGPYAYLGQIMFIILDPAYFGPDYVMLIEETNDSEVLIVVDGDFNTHAIDGGLFTFNCSDPLFCPCLYGCPSPTVEASWSDLKSLY